MPAHHGSRSNQDERLGPPRPERFQGDPEQLVQSCQSTARSLGVQSEQLLTESKIFEDEVLSGTESIHNPSQEMSERRHCGQNHDLNLIEIRRIELACKSFIPRVHEILTRDRINLFDLITDISGLHSIKVSSVFRNKTHFYWRG
jgi:hypothetical protein